MKRILNVIVGFIGLLYFIAIGSNQLLAQSVQKNNENGKPIPSEVIKITDKSCKNCHYEPGKLLALAKLNLSKWDSYPPEKQAAKSKAMYNELSKNDMPPKKFRKKNPGAIPTPEDVKTILEWAKSLQPAKK
jgi:hypothetical protein